MERLTRVLLVDDDEIAQFLTYCLLTDSGCVEVIHTAGNGSEAFQFLLQECSNTPDTTCCVDLVLLDINMPIMGGFDFLRALREASFKCSPKIVLLTSSTHPTDMELAKEFEVAGVIEKPLTDEKLTAILAEISNCQC